MKRILLPLAFLATLSSHAQTGAWSGSITVQGMKLNMVFHLSADACTLDVPAQGAKGIPAKMTKTSEGITIDIPAIRGSFKGKHDGSSIQGEFSQHGMSFPLTLTQGEAEIKRPQTPVAPFPYTSEEVSFSNGAAVLSGTLTLPEDYSEKTPVLVMVTGSGPQDRNSTILAHQPFLIIADAFARQGIATLRYDDRGVGRSTGDLKNATTLDFKNDALAAVTLLRKRFKKVGVLGHSEGGTIALMISGEKKADFAISLAGAVVSGKEILVEQNRKMLLASGIAEKEVDEYCKALDCGFSLLAEGKELSSIPEQTISNAALKANFTKAMQASSTPYLRYFLKLAGCDFLKGIKCPVLALNGTKDFQVDAKQNLGALRNALSSKKSKIIEKEGLNHLFQHANTGMASEYGTIEETIAPEVLTDMIQWIKTL